MARPFNSLPKIFGAGRQYGTQGPVAGNPYAGEGQIGTAATSGPPPQQRQRPQPLRNLLSNMFGPRRTGQVPPPPQGTDWEGELGPRREAVFNQTMADLQSQYDAEKTDQERAEGLSRDISLGFGNLQDEMIAEQGDVNTRFDAIQAQIDVALGKTDGMAPAVKAEFDALKNEYLSEWQSALARVQGLADEALGRVMQGQAEVISSVTAGTQSNTRDALSQIDAAVARGEMTAAQGDAMKAQTRMTGGLNLAQAVGNTAFQFRELEAKVAGEFGGILGNLEATGVSGLGQLEQTAGTQYAQTLQAASQIGANLLNVKAQSESYRNAAQAALYGHRVTAEHMGDQLQLELLPQMDEPFIQYTDAYVNDYVLTSDIFARQEQERLNLYGMEVMATAANYQSRSDWVSNLLAGLQFGKRGGFVAILGNAFAGLNQNITGGNQGTPYA